MTRCRDRHNSREVVVFGVPRDHNVRATGLGPSGESGGASLVVVVPIMGDGEPD